jgi:peptidyl-prolyl cis-trans isomerase D
MRNSLKSWIGKVVIALFVAPFLFIGAQSFFSVFNSEDAALEINGEVINNAQVVREVEMNKENLRRQFGEGFDMSIFSAEALREGAIGQLIERELSTQYAINNNLGVPRTKVHEIIRDIPAFAGEDGSFSQEVFETVAVQQGRSPKSIIELVQNDITSSHPRQALSISSFALSNEVQLKESLKAQERDISYLLLTLEDFENELEIGEAEINAFYQENLHRYTSEETVRIEYLELKVSNFADDMLVSDDEIKARLEEEQEALNETANRRASHILVEVNDDRNDQEAYERISEALAKLESGENFSTLAKAYSDDPGSAESGGDLGFAGKGDYVPEFEEALFSMEKGDVSEPILTEFGYHVIKLVDIAATKQLKLSEEKERLSKALKRNAAQSIYQEKITLLEDNTFESPDLDEAALSAQLEIQVSPFFSREKGEGIAANEEIRKLAFTTELLEDGENSNVTELNDGHAIVLRVKDHRPSAQKPLETVKEDVIATLKEELAKEKLMNTKDELLAKLEAGESAYSVADSINKEWELSSNTKRRDSGLPQEILAKAFEMPRPAEGEKSLTSVAVGENDLALIALTKVHDKQNVVEEDRIDFLTMQFSRMEASFDWNKHMSHLKAEADINIKGGEAEEGL